MIDLSDTKITDVNIDKIYNKLNLSNDVNFFWLGTQDYAPIFELQKKIYNNILYNKSKDVVLMLEHQNVYTLGKNANKNHILPLSKKYADIAQCDRGGDVTYHGPGQLVCYPIINLNNYNKSITWYIEFIEKTIIKVLEKNKIKASKKESPLIGIWVDDEKIAAIGVRLSRWISTHGFAINVNTDLSYFDGIIPCGIFDHGVTSIKKVIKREVSVKLIANQVKESILGKLTEVPIS
tara:strand:+ start:807 stop:1514 length:708 start_codon:yes stop_codon:yes gene_type:complete